MKLMCKIDKILNWVLGAFFILFILTGFDIQRRFLSPQISSLIHLKWFVLPVLVAFGFHTVYKIAARIQKRERYYLLKWILLGAYTGFIVWMIVYFIYYTWIV
jgi:hypothetical protein